MPLNWQGRSGASELAKNTAWIGLGRAIRTGIQALYFILIARALGAREYGAYVGVVALVGVAAPFAGLGSGNLLIKHVARAPDTFRAHWGKAIGATLLTGTILLAVVTLGAKVLLPNSIPPRLVMLVAASDLLFSRLLDVSAQAYQGLQRLDRTAQVQLLLSPVRLVAAGVLVVTTAAPTALDWGLYYFLSSVLGCGAAVVLVSRELGAPVFDLRHLASELREGTFFSVSLSTQTIYNDIDKTMLTRLGTLEAAGVYGAAYRVIDVAFLPVGSLISASYPRFFQRGLAGVEATAGLARRLLRVGASYGVLAAIALYASAPLLPMLLGDQYTDASAAIRWLALLPLLKSIHYFGADALTGAGYQGVRTALQVGIAVVNVALNLWLIPLYSWPGAAAASLLSDGLLAIGVWMAVHRLIRREARARPPGEPSSVLELG